jgi:hypothetical protein
MYFANHLPRVIGDFAFIASTSPRSLLGDEAVLKLRGTVSRTLGLKAERRQCRWYAADPGTKECTI